jgi:uncharacterized membrane protein
VIEWIGNDQVGDVLITVPIYLVLQARVVTTIRKRATSSSWRSRDHGGLVLAGRGH